MTHASDPDEHDPRLVELELRFMHQEALLEELSGVLFRQQTTIERLEARTKELERRLSEGGGEAIPIERPPHY